MTKCLIFWLVLAVVFAIFEASTAALVSIWFALAAVVAFLATFLGIPFWAQLSIFAVFSVIFLLLTKKVVKRIQDTPKVRTNADLVIGKSALVTEEIDNVKSAGRVKIDGQDWSARSLTGDVFVPGQMVRVHKIEGVKVLVTREELAPQQ